MHRLIVQTQHYARTSLILCNLILTPTDTLAHYPVNLKARAIIKCTNDGTQLDGRDTFDITASQLLNDTGLAVASETGWLVNCGGGVWNGRKQEARKFEPNRAPVSIPHQFFPPLRTGCRHCPATHLCREVALQFNAHTGENSCMCGAMYYCCDEKAGALTERCLVRVE